MFNVVDSLLAKEKDYSEYFHIPPNHHSFSSENKGLELGKISVALDNDCTDCNYSLTQIPGFWESFGLGTGMAGRLSCGTILSSWLEFDVNGRHYDYQAKMHKPPRMTISSSDLTEIEYELVAGLKVRQTFMAVARGVLLVDCEIESKDEFGQWLFFGMLPAPMYKNAFNIAINPVESVKVLPGKRTGFEIKKKFALGEGLVSVDEGMGDVEEEFYLKRAVVSYMLKILPGSKNCKEGCFSDYPEMPEIGQMPDGQLGYVHQTFPSGINRFQYIVSARNDSEDNRKNLEELALMDVNTLKSQMLRSANRFFRGVPDFNEGKKDYRRVFYTSYQRLRTYQRNAFGAMRYPYYLAYTSNPDGLFLWDSAFLAQAVALRDFHDAENQMRNFMYNMDEDGLIACQLGAYSVDNGAHRPFLAWGAWQIFMQSGNTDFIREVFPYVLKNLKYHLAHRMNPDYTARLNHAGESGWDNFSAYIDDNDCGKRELLTDRHLWWTVCYLKITEILRKMLPFVEDQSSADFVFETEKKLRVGMETLFDPEQNIFCSFKGKEPCRIKTFEPLFAMWLKSLPEERVVETMEYYKKYFQTDYPVASVAVSDEHFKMDYWKGPTWIPTNVLLIHSFYQHGKRKEALELSKKTVNMVIEGMKYGNIFHENYNPKTGEPSILSPGGRSVETMWNTSVVRLILDYQLGLRSFKPPVDGNLYLELDPVEDGAIDNVKFGEWSVDFASSVDKLNDGLCSLRLKRAKPMYQTKAVVEIRSAHPRTLNLKLEFYNSVRGFAKIVKNNDEALDVHSAKVTLLPGQILRLDMQAKEWRIDYSQFKTKFDK